MDRVEFDAWIEQNYKKLVNVALRYTRKTAAPGCDYGRDAACDAVQAATERALTSPTLAALPADLAWPFMVNAVRSTAAHERERFKRAQKTLYRSSGSLSAERGKHTRIPMGEETDEARASLPIGKRGSGRIVALEQDHNDDENGHHFAGPRGDYQGEYTISCLGLHACQCSAPLFNRVEVGTDVEWLDYNKLRSVRLLTAIEHAVHNEPINTIGRAAGLALGAVVMDVHRRYSDYRFQVLACWNGHRTYTGEV